MHFQLSDPFSIPCRCAVAPKVKQCLISRIFLFAIVTKIEFQVHTSPQTLVLTLGTVYKPRRQVRGEGVAQMSTLLNKSYLVKGSTKGGGGVKNAPNSVYVVCTQPH